ncbi:hypothetical protein HK405_005457 [Cladochytrium tenue]|nr:hypothetical protein HK405_005457 [Cladochytrium tenue]
MHLITFAAAAFLAFGTVPAAASTTVAASAPTSAPTTSTSAGASSGFRCGTSWAAANAVCGTSCPNAVDSECPSGQYCYADLDQSLYDLIIDTALRNIVG